MKKIIKASIVPICVCTNIGCACSGGRSEHTGPSVLVRACWSERADPSILIETSSCKLQFFSEQITTQFRDFHMVSPQVVFTLLLYSSSSYAHTFAGDVLFTFRWTYMVESLLRSNFSGQWNSHHRLLHFTNLDFVSEICIKQ